MSKAAKLECENCPSQHKGIFCELESLALKNVSENKVVNKYKKGQTLFVQGNPPFGMYCVSTGNIKISQVGEDGKESIVRIASAGDVLGHRSIFTEQYYNATATAVEDCTVCFLDKKYILKLVKESPAVATNIISKLGKDLGAAEKRLTSFYQKNVRERLAEFLLLLKESHGVKEAEGIRLDIKLTREEMASIIATAPETLIRFMSELKQEGFIEQKGKTIYITDEPGLLEFANILY
ncbi:MAG: transcriptional regulator [Halobacteriovoraceae bacterium]|nr:transcriptional regulator [Halobacteriovoraceae bacterium]